MKRRKDQKATGRSALGAVIVTNPSPSCDELLLTGAGRYDWHGPRGRAASLAGSTVALRTARRMGYSNDGMTYTASGRWRTMYWSSWASPRVIEAQLAHEGCRTPGQGP